MLHFLWALFLLIIVLSLPFIPGTYINIHIVLLVLFAFLSFVMLIIERRKVLIVFPENTDSKSSTPSTTWGDNNSHPQYPSANPDIFAHPLYKKIINERIFYPYLDILLLIGGLLMAGVLLLLSIYNIFLILGSVVLYYIILDKLIKRYEKTKGDLKNGK